MRRPAHLVAFAALMLACSSDTTATGAQDTGATDSPDATGAVAQAECTSAAGCVALNDPAPLCQTWDCVDGACERVAHAAGLTCQPGDRCLLPGTCVDGMCAGTTARDCDDGNPCTTDSCVPGIGCDHAFATTACDDGDACTVADACVDGVCVSGTARVCDDANACTHGDTCDPGTGACVFAAAAACDDGDPCTLSDACDPGTGSCAGTAVANCDCDTVADCAHLDDGDACNGTLICDDQRCALAPGSVVSCPTSTDPCVAVACDPANGQCAFDVANDGTPCAPAGACVLAGTCQGATCVQPPRDCGDTDPCTADGCDLSGCTHVLDVVCACGPGGCPVEAVYGDALTLEDSHGSPIETVEVAIIDDLALTCGGFGLDAFAFSADQASIDVIGGAPGVSRCQNLAPGPVLTDGRRLIFAAHHGDAYVKTPGVYAVPLKSDGSGFNSAVVTTLPGVSFEGMAYDTATGLLWVAAHAQGIFRFLVNPQTGALTQHDQLQGFNNAWRLVLGPAHAYVADGAGGLVVVDRATFQIVASVPTPGFAKDVVLAGDVALVAESTLGVGAYDVTIPSQPAPLQAVLTHGSALDLALFDAGTKLAVANFTDIVVIDIATKGAYALVAMDRATSVAGVPRVLAVDGRDETLFVGEWLGPTVLRWHDGLIAPEIQLERQSHTFANVPLNTTAIENIGVSNHGQLDLVVSSVSASNPAVWSVVPDSFTVAPGGIQAVTILFEPVSTGATADAIRFISNDPDEGIVDFPVVGNPSSFQLDIGDMLTGAFDFLDTDHPPGEQSVANLQGEVLVLAYFATF